MVELIWTEPALQELDAIAEYIALDKPLAASRYVEKVFKKVERLELFPRSGKKVNELSNTPYLALVVPPCRIFYRYTENTVYILHIMRSERMLRIFMLKQADPQVSFNKGD